MTFQDTEIDPLWHLHDELTVDQAAALIAGYDPGHIERCKYDTNFDSNFPRLYAARTAIINAINARKLTATIRHNARTSWGWDERLSNGESIRAFDPELEGHIFPQTVIYHEEPNWSITTVAVDNLKAWLISRGYKSGFFFPSETKLPGYLDPNHPSYAPKLAAAVAAWEAVNNDSRYMNNGRTVKQNIESWLEAHAAEFDLINHKGEIIKDAIENQISKVANWQDKGGAPKTPAK